MTYFYYGNYFNNNNNIEMCMRKGVKVNAGMSKVMVLNGDEGLEYKVLVNEMRLEHV